MRVAVYPSDPWGCGHYRLIWPARVLRDQGHDVTITMPGDVDAPSGLVVNDRLAAIYLQHDADVYVFQRPTMARFVDMIRVLRSRGKTVVVDMDDDLSCIHPKNRVFGMLHPKCSPWNNWQHAQEGCAAATLVTVSTPELQRRYGRLRSRVLRNCVPAAFLTVDTDRDRQPVWGWGGSLHSHPDDVPLLGAAVAELRRRGHPFYVVGSPEGVGGALGLSEDPSGTGPVAFGDWAAALTRLDVGVAPLADTQFNRAKSWLKPLEYAAVGVPWVASDMGEYKTLQGLGAGTMAGRRARDWVRPVHELLTNDAARREASEACRAVAAQLTIEEHAWRWWETWDVARQLDRQQRQPVPLRVP